MNQPADQAARQRAIDPGSSFIVQAPAGSGKTELLTQRFLGLLATVDRPQKVLAITFTRKATREMADRILERLHGAASGSVPGEEHVQVAHELALKVIKRDREMRWGLLDNPSQLQIHTIDGLCARLASRDERASLAVSGLRVTDTPKLLFEEAARRCLERVATSSGTDSARIALEELLIRQKGNSQYLAELLAGELGRRDQWLSQRSGSEMADSRAVLAWRQSCELTMAEDTLGRERIERLLGLLADVIRLADDGSAGESFLNAWARSKIRPDDGERLCAMHRAFLLLGTKTNGLPKAPQSFNKNFFPSADPERGRLLQQIKEAIPDWRDDDASSEWFQRFFRTPPLDEVHGNDELLNHMRILLQEACVELFALFAERGQCDYQHVTQQAIVALGADLSPGEALLIEDGRLEHILIDEFQDTSQAQYSLLELLTSGWSGEDGRSLFLVGDPMQSIYRFRKADVELFKRVWRDGHFGEVPVETLSLEVNFRSRPEILRVINAQAPRFFRKPSAVATGHVGYAPFEPARDAGGGVVVTAFEGDDEPSAARAEARWIAGELARMKETGERGSVGILCRKRTQLEQVANALKEAGVAFEGVDIQRLDSRDVVRDLLCLSRALLHPGDRIAWLALMQAPWCALSARELHHVAGDDRDACLLDRMRGAPAVSEESAVRVRRLAEVMTETRTMMARAPLADCVESAWIQLAGPCSLADLSDLDNAERFLALLSEVEQSQPEDILGLLAHRLETLYASSAASDVQLMTIHKAKGLEFDRVFLPALAGISRRSRPRLFRQHDFRLDDDRRGSLFAPLKPSGDSRASLYDYLRILEKEESFGEDQRLLYVAMTRAREQLFLSTGFERKRDGSIACSENSFLAMLMPLFEQDPEPVEVQPVDASASGLKRAAPLRQMEPLPELSMILSTPPEEAASLGERWPERQRLALGQAFHRWLELIHDHWHDAPGGEWQQESFAHHGPALESSLVQAGARIEEARVLREPLADLLRDALTGVESSAALSPVHKRQSFAEAEYLFADGYQLRRKIIDRLYEDGEGHWVIIDYKTGADRAQTREQWVQQLSGYAHLVQKGERGAVDRQEIFLAEDGVFIDPATD